MRVLVVMNPGAGQGVHLPFFLRRMLKLPQKEDLSAGELRERIDRGLRGQGVQPEFEGTQYPGHATVLARQAAAEGFDAVVAVGGDGTVNEVVNGLAGTETALGIIPAGTANLFAAELGIPSDIQAACAVVGQDVRKIIDLGFIDGRYFTMMAGIGFDAHVVRLVDRRLKGQWGAFSYLIVALRELVRYSFPRIEAITDTGESLFGYYAFVQNACSYGSGFEASPGSRLDDGLFEVIVFPRRRFFTVIQYLLSARKESCDVVTRSIRKLELRTPHDIQIDGDFFSQGPAVIELRARSLHVLTARL